MTPPRPSDDLATSIEVVRGLGSRVFAARTARGLSQRDVGDVVGVTRPTISYLERGTRWPSVEVVLALLAWLREVRSDEDDRA